MQGTEYSQPEAEHAENIAPEDRRLINCRPGENVIGGIFAISEKQFKKTAAGKSYLQFKLRDGTGERMAKWFTPPEDAFENVKSADFVRVNAYVDLNPSFLGDFKINFCEAVETPADQTPFLTPLPENHGAHQARFREIVRGVKNPFLFSLLKEIFRTDGEFWPLFKVAPAARKLHHAYRGGLLEHTAEVALLCERVANTLPHLDCDLLLTAALLHDIGKLEEMESDLSSGEYTTAGHLVGHIVLGTCTVAGAIEKVDNFPLELKHELMHLILSHHGRLEYGAAKIPMCAEAIVLSMCDLMSAKTAQCREKIEGGLEGDFLSKSDSYGWDSEKIYLGSMRRMLNNGVSEGEADENQA